MKQLTMRIPIKNRSVNEVNKIVQAVLLKHRFAMNTKDDKPFWTYRMEDWGIVPCISSEIENRTLILRGWLHHKSAEEYGCELPDFMESIPKLRVRKIMLLIAYIVRYGKTRKA